jgi:NAD(P)-dependent dehydrogenase (short-subunit alcohol dehydrogenase family)
VTGGARGLGFTIAQSLLQSGAHVRAVDILPESVEPAWSSALELAESKGLTLTYTRLDVTDPSAVTSAFSDIFSSAPPDAPIRGLFVAAGIQLLKKAEEISAAEFRKIIDVNLTGTFLCAQGFAREWFKAEANQGADGRAGGNGASVVMTGSMSGHIANFGMEIAAYNSSKAGVSDGGAHVFKTG